MGDLLWLGYSLDCGAGPAVALRRERRSAASGRFARKRGWRGRKSTSRQCFRNGTPPKQRVRVVGYHLILAFFLCVQMHGLAGYFTFAAEYLGL